jgi:hypothetical protein
LVGAASWGWWRSWSAARLIAHPPSSRCAGPMRQAKGCASAPRLRNSARRAAQSDDLSWSGLWSGSGHCGQGGRAPWSGLRNGAESFVTHCAPGRPGAREGGQVRHPPSGMPRRGTHRCGVGPGRRAGDGTACHRYLDLRPPRGGRPTRQIAATEAGRPGHHYKVTTASTWTITLQAAGPGRVPDSGPKPGPRSRPWQSARRRPSSPSDRVGSKHLLNQLLRYLSNQLLQHLSSEPCGRPQDRAGHQACHGVVGGLTSPYAPLAASPKPGK